MAGYKSDYSRSNSAAAAERDGFVTATAAARILKCKSAAVLELLVPEAWHHTGSRFNETKYFDVSELAEAAAEGFVPESAEETAAADTLAALRAWRADEQVLYEGAAIPLRVVEWRKNGSFGKWNPNDSVLRVTRIVVKRMSTARDRNGCAEIKDSVSLILEDGRKTRRLLKNVFRQTLPGGQTIGEFEFAK